MKHSIVALKRKLESEDVSSKKSRTESPGASGKATRYAIETDEKIQKWASYKRNNGTWILK